MLLSCLLKHRVYISIILDVLFHLGVIFHDFYEFLHFLLILYAHNALGVKGNLTCQEVYENYEVLLIIFSLIQGMSSPIPSQSVPHSSHTVVSTSWPLLPYSVSPPSPSSSPALSPVSASSSPPLPGGVTLLCGGVPPLGVWDCLCFRVKDLVEVGITSITFFILFPFSLHLTSWLSS